MSDEKFGKYNLVRKLATGGMAEIWLAEQRGPGGFSKRLVIKRILPHLAEEGEMTQMFIDEARIVAHLTHPNIGQVYELGEQDGDYFIAMEYIDGLDLSELRNELKDQGVDLPISHAARIVCDVLQALDYAHNFKDHEGNEVDLIHRDVSPQNVLISAEGVVKLVDFGVAKTELNRHKTETGAVKGKFAYMAPEQIRDATLDCRVDIFAIGAVFYELMTGKKPFGDDLQAVSRITTIDATDPRTHRDDIPESIAKIVLRALERDREKRFSTAAEMEKAIEESYLRTLNSGVGTRELAKVVRSVREEEGAPPTRQLFGPERQGAEHAEESGEKDRGETLSPGRSYQMTPQTASATPSELDREESTVTPPASAADRGGISPLGVAAAIGTVVLVLVSVAAVGSVFVFGEPVDGSIAAAEAAEGQAVWRHTEDALIVYVDSDEPAQLYREGQRVGETPFHTTLRPGDYTVELHGASDAREVEISVEPDRSVQRFRFEL